jgi:hypothetical protein
MDLVKQEPGLGKNPTFSVGLKELITFSNEDNDLLISFLTLSMF